MDIIRATKVKVDLDINLAKETVEAWRGACRYISLIAFENGCVTNPIRLHHLTYYQVRQRFGLSAQVTQNAIRQVSSKYAALRKLKQTPKTPVNYRGNTVILQGGKKGRDFSFRKTGASIWTVRGRIKRLTFHGAPKLTEYLATWQLADAQLCVDKNRVFLSPEFRRTVTPIDKPNDAVLGVDRGINHISVVTNGRTVKFFSGKQAKIKRRQYVKIKASMQKNLAKRKKAHKDTRSIRRCLKRLSGKEARFGRNVNHTVTRRIIQFAQATGNPTIAIEHLDGIRKRRLHKQQRDDIHRWSFYQWEAFLRYKANDCAFDVIEVDSNGTSKGCSHCGYANKNNRHRSDFSCKACGYSVHADLNASRNIRLRGILARQVLCQVGPLSIGPETQPQGMGKLSVSTESN